MCMGMVQEAREEREEGERVGEEEADSKVAVRSTWPQLWQLPRPLQLLSHRPTATAESEVFNASSYTD